MMAADSIKMRVVTVCLWVKMLQKLLTLHICAHSIQNHLHCDQWLARLLGTPRLLFKFKFKLKVFGPSDNKTIHNNSFRDSMLFFRLHQMHKEILIVLSLTFELRCCSALYRQFSVLLHIARASGVNALCPWRIRNPQLTIRQLYSKYLLYIPIRFSRNFFFVNLKYLYTCCDLCLQTSSLWSSPDWSWHGCDW